MDELELLKKDWQKDNNNYPKLSKEDIFPMLLKKSSSIVKTLLYISIAELILWVVVNILPFFLSEESNEKLNTIKMSELYTNTVIVLSISIVLVFIYLLYKAYKSISVTDNSKTLMRNILKTRKIVQMYVGINVALLIFLVFNGVLTQINQNPEFASELNQATTDGEIFKYYAAIIIGTVLILAVVVGIGLLIYWLIYGLLLNKLNRNYRELKKLEM